MSISEQFQIDEIDKNIITLLQANPNITHSDIAKKINRSQPAVGSRIHRLEERGVISSQFGINFKNSPKINLVKIEIETKDPKEIYQMGEHCPFVINCMKLSGQNNMMIFLASSSLKKIDAIIDHHFRDRPNIMAVRMDIITDFCKNFILPIDFRMDDFDPDPEKGCSNDCPAYKDVSPNK